MNHSPEHLSMMKTQGARKRLANKAEREAKTIHLEGGAKVYPDSPPGVGWVLLLPVGHKCYMRSAELCVELWDKKYKADPDSYPREAKGKLKAA